MKVLVIPDVHLKPWMLQRASELMEETESDLAVCLMDIADDWRQQFNLDLFCERISGDSVVLWQSRCLLSLESERNRLFENRAMDSLRETADPPGITS